MASMRDIKRRIKSVNSTRQITKAMNLVASSKLSRAKGRFISTQPFFRQTRKAIAQIVTGSSGISHPYLKEREVKNTCVMVITGDRGLCGGYNTNVCKTAISVADERENITFVTIGNKGREYLKHRHKDISASYRGISEKPQYCDARIIGEEVLKKYDAGEIDEVYLAYTEFISTISNEPKLIKLLPMDASEFSDEHLEKSSTLTIYEPSEEEVLDYIVPKYVNTILYGAMVESAACELSSRMTAMDSATENASEMIDDLNLLYNRVRQGAITQEITEIVGGSNALSG
jgi:F-type H+-transporting ATPase subunit gamma